MHRVQNSFARLVFSDYLRNARHPSKLQSHYMMQRFNQPHWYQSKSATCTRRLCMPHLSLIHNKHNSLVPVNRLRTNPFKNPFKRKSNQIIDFCNDLQKLASRVKESEIAERGNEKKSPVVAKL
ncbi:hypothetical protein RHMOL_Rhmol11G0240800 [Rhododendron molle]|uniref:Uncharacterized protein n=1 Tax=Rhododendron molle TaxID=49168 RepID=A0ACC0LX89_RHOML|nr:hypothetical protein RHMOL_Rhmol11G0240800 [Rhododendron molle]